MDAAHALLGVSPATVAGIHSMMNNAKPKRSLSSPIGPVSQPPSRPNGLDALATLACTRMDAHVATPSPIASLSSATKVIPSCGSSSSDEDDLEAMPPPPPRRRRNRSVSNPEGMEKWERQYFVLPTAIIEEELAEAKAATEAKEEEDRRRREAEAATAAAAVVAIAPSSSSKNSNMRKRTSPISVASPMDEVTLPPEELLRRARSRLLEDLSEGSLQGEKGSLTLPHCLSKYKNVYNKNGRIGIYTPAERAAIISRFQDKRSRRVWNKKIRYSCRKNLADRRLRVKGRFVKRPPAVPVAPAAPVLDVTNKEAGFQPTEDLPYRRQRRHTIT